MHYLSLKAAFKTVKNDRDPLKRPLKKDRNPLKGPLKKDRNPLKRLHSSRCAFLTLPYSKEFCCKTPLQSIASQHT
jgi:hypothetical protein